MSEDTHLRSVTVDLYTESDALREQAADARQEREELVAEVREEYGDAQAAPQELHDQYDDLTAEATDAEGTAETFAHYADAWTGQDADTCEFTLTELNGDEYAKVVDTVSGAAPQGGDLPGGAAAVTALNHAVTSVPEGAPNDAGKWPAPVVDLLFEELNDLTTPGASEMGNSSLSAAVSQTPATDGGDSPPEDG